MTNNRPDQNQVPTGQSNHTNANNNTNNSSTTQESNNPFGNGGSGGGTGGGTGSGMGQDSGSGANGTGGTGNGGARSRLNHVSVAGIQINVRATIHLKLTIDSKGNVVSALTTFPFESIVNFK